MKLERQVGRNRKERREEGRTGVKHKEGKRVKDERKKKQMIMVMKMRRSVKITRKRRLRRI